MLPSTFSPAAVARKCSVEKVFLRFRKIHRKAPAPESLFSLFVTFSEHLFYRTPPVAVSFSLKSLGFINCFAVNCFSS